jgi:hypothetical protein
MVRFSQPGAGLLSFWRVNTVLTGFVLEPFPPIVALGRKLLLEREGVNDNPCTTPSRTTSRYFESPTVHRGQERT